MREGDTEKIRLVPEDAARTALRADRPATGQDRRDEGYQRLEV